MASFDAVRETGMCVGEVPPREPLFFSIGVTTYNRKELLRQLLDSILAQTYGSYEVLVGNDYTKEVLSGEALGLSDPRIRFINHPVNLGELRNMNSLLAASRGRYFTWVADDDLYDFRFLASIHRALTSSGLPACAFASYAAFRGERPLPQFADPIPEGESLSGAEFLRRYLRGEIKTIGVMGAFDRAYLHATGGLEDLSGENIAILSEYMLLLRTGACGRVCYIDAPLTLYREHGESWGIKNTDVEVYKRTGRELLSRSLGVLQQPELRGDFRPNLFGVLRICLSYVFGTASKDPRHYRFHDLAAYYLSLRRELRLFGGRNLRSRAAMSWLQAGFWLSWSVVKFTFKSNMPPSVVWIAVKLRTMLMGSRAL